MHKKRFKNWFVISLLSILIAVFALIAIYFGYQLYKNYFPVNNDGNLLVSYNSSDKLDYAVDVNDNPYYSHSDNLVGKQIVSSTIDKINFDVNYDFSSSKSLDYIYTYSISAVLVGNYDNEFTDVSNELWTKEFVIEPDIKINYNDTNKIDFNRSFQIDYQKYNDIMKGFRDEFNLSIDAYLKIIFKSNIISLPSNNQSIDEDDKIEIKMPLLKDTTYVKYDNTGIVNKNVWASVKSSDSPINIFPLIAMFAIALAVLYLSTKLHATATTDKYFVEVNKLYKKYKDILVKVDELPNKDDLKIIMVNNFIDMCDLNKEVNSPVLFYDSMNSVEFFIIKDQCYYTYAIKRVKF